jgi:hypothetical protein
MDAPRLEAKVDAATVDDRKEFVNCRCVCSETLPVSRILALRLLQRPLHLRRVQLVALEDRLELGHAAYILTRSRAVTPRFIALRPLHPPQLTPLLTLLCPL